MPTSFNTTFPEVSKSPVLPSAGGRVNKEWITVVWILMGAGVFFRLFHFLDNRSLYVDEIFLATSLVKMNFWELTAPMLEYEQKAPLGFLWMERLMVLLFGTGEMALRLFPLICGVASLFLFLPVARYFLKPVGVVVAIGVLAAAPPLVYHAVEVKQYSTEMFATVVALYLYIRFHKKMALPSLLLWGLSGAVILWFSFSSIFILAGMAFGVCLHYLLKKEWRHLFRSINPFSMWLVSFAATYFLFTHKHGDSEWLLHWFRTRDSFMPLPPTSLSELSWFFKKIFSVLHYPLGLSWLDLSPSANPIVRIIARMSLLPLAVLAVGFAVFYRKDRKHFMVLVFPVLLVLIASGLELYPFMDRLVVFLAPVLILILALGCEKLSVFFFKTARGRFILPALLLLGPLANSSHQIINRDVFGDYKKSYQRETLSYIDDRFQEGDAVYIYWNDLVGYRYYKAMRGFRFEAVEGKDYRYVAKDEADYYRRLSADFEKLSGNKRVWLVYSNWAWFNIGDFDGQPAWYYAPESSRATLHKTFSTIGEEIDTYKTTEVNVHLFDLQER
ncbi:hypothetical protein DXT99_15545 [Pontibacter diazotrophicus]|uniref:Glycosyltransferase RgtA/B/C/D-like domain-containing protein n=1 Tax=Pontibacter diazotrophicus TaxID=1400979 RepID=A0A3D8L9W8_9BACT|nr:glycosyltransferase family 39 protein [Pontibacter diazotrophicus]RDV14205.1 hypothetical protein DXT99_15545 [Pontibacter diazotrophicus]